MQPGVPSVTVKDAVAIIRLNRPEQHNRLDAADIDTLNQIITEIDADDAIRAVVLTAEGRSFCSGYDIGSFSADPGGSPNAQSGHDFNGVCDRLEQLRQPVICALNGSVYGGAIDLALACDFRLGHDGIIMSMPAARLGLHYYASGQARYISRLGLNVAKRLFLVAEPFDAPEMLRCGFLTEIVARDVLLEKALALAGRIARNAPVAVQDMKRSLNEIAAGVGETEVINARFSRSLASEDFKEGRRAFAERRTPDFTGH